MQRNHFFLTAEMHLGLPQPLPEEALETEESEEICPFSPPWSFDPGLDKTAEFEQQIKGLTLHWYDQVDQTKSITPWLDLTQSTDFLSE